MHVGALWGDRIYDGMRASDGTPIDSRTKHRRFMKERNLTTVDDYKETWKGDAKVREEIRTDGGDHKERKRQIVEAVNQLEAQRRR
jgi:hypothetical protein